MSHETKIVHGKPLGDSKRWIAQCSCGRRSDSWLDCDDARANLANMHPPGVLLSDPRDAEIVALRARVAALEADIASRSGTWTRCRCGGTFRAPKQTGMSVPEHTCPGCRRAEVAEDKLAALEAVERAAREYRAEIADARGDHPGIREWKRKQDALDAALAATEVPRG